MFIVAVVIFIKEKDIKTMTGWLLAVHGLISFVASIITFAFKMRKKLLSTDYEKTLKKQIAKIEKTKQ